MPGPIRTRQSCDRCHGQKLKCPKNPGTAVCARCDKVGSACVFSPVGSGGLVSAPGHAHITPQNHDGLMGSFAPIGGDCSESSAHMPGLEWGPLGQGFEGLGHAPMDMTDLLSTPDVTWRHATTLSTEPLEQSDSTSQDSPATAEERKSSCTNVLTQILLDLDTIWTSILPSSHLHAPFDDTIWQTTADLSARYRHDKLLQDFFAVAQRLLNIYPIAAASSLSLCPGDVECTDPKCIHRLPVPPTLRPVDEATDGRNAPGVIDLSLGNLLVSCHLRVLDVMDRILSLAISCHKITSNSPQGREPGYNVPVVTVGSFTPTRDASAVMHTYLLKHLVVRLGAEAEKLARDVHRGIAEGADRESKVLGLLCEVVVERQGEKVGQLKVLGEELVGTSC